MTNEERRVSITNVVASLFRTMDDILDCANQLEEAKCKADADKLRKLAGRLENQIHNINEKGG
jgi:hypothetical protein